MFGSARLRAVLPSITSRRLVHSTARMAQRRGFGASPRSMASRSMESRSSAGSGEVVVEAMTHSNWQFCHLSSVTLGTNDKSAVLSYGVHMPSLRQRHTERTRDAIVDAAFELFAAKGYAETTIDEIAERADIAPRTFFRYFPAKEAVLFHGADDQVEEAVAKLRARPADETPYESLVAVLRSIAAELTHDDKRERMLAKFAAESDRLFEHHRAVVMCRFEESITAVR